MKKTQKKQSLFETTSETRNVCVAYFYEEHEYKKC